MKFPKLPRRTTIAADTDATARSPRRSWMPGALMVVAAALPIGWLYWQLAVADEMLGALGSARVVVRSTYTSTHGYGPEGGPALPAGGALPGWRDEGEGRYMAPGGQRLQVVSRVRTFDVTLSGLKPAVCRLVARSLDGGWTQVRVNGSVSNAERAGRLMSGDCGWWGDQTIRLTSAG